MSTFFLSSCGKKEKTSPINTKSELRAKEENAHSMSSEEQEVEELKAAVNTRNSDVVSKEDIEAFMKRLETMTDKELIAFMDQESALRDAILYKHTQSIFERLTKYDPELAMKYAEQCDFLAGDMAIFTIFRVWAKQDIESALARAIVSDDLAFKENALGVTLGVLCEHQPERAIELSSQLIWSSISSYMFLDSLARQHPELALSLFEQVEVLSYNDRYARVYRGTFRTISVKDFDKALELLQRVSDKIGRNYALEGILGGIGRRSDLKQMLLDSLGSEDERDRVEKIDRERKLQDNIRVRPEWVANNFLEKGFQGIEVESIQNAFIGFARKDLDAFIEYIPRIKDEEVKKIARSKMLNQWSINNSEQALDYFVENYDKDHFYVPAWNEISEDLMEGLPSNLARNKPQEALDILLSLKPNEGRNSVVSDTLAHWYLDAAEQVDSYLSRQDLDHELVAQVHKAIGRNYGLLDVSEGIKWLQTLEDESAIIPATVGLVNMGMFIPSDITINWVNTLPEGKQRDYAAKEVSKRLAEADYETSVEWASSISSKSMREEVLVEIKELYQSAE